MEQPIKKSKFSYFARSRLRLRPQEIWERDYVLSNLQGYEEMNEVIKKSRQYSSTLRTICKDRFLDRTTLLRGAICKARKNRTYFSLYKI